MNSTNLRHQALNQWLATVLPASYTLQPMIPGAGLRRYHRVKTHAESYYVVMDAINDPKCEVFTQLAQQFLALGVQVPTVHAADLTQGFLLLTDFGRETYAELLTLSNVDELYQLAFDALLRIQAYPQQGNYPLRDFDMVHYQEKMRWFMEYYLQHTLNFSLTKSQQTECERLFDVLIDQALRQPMVCVHYDYHCRNLMKLAGNQVGVLDFQDAVRGPITYDLMALLRDCYIHWSPSQVQAWIRQYQHQALRAGRLAQEDPALWLRWCNFSSAQRHIKCIGLFARFNVLGNSAEYLRYIPRSLRYLREISAHYPEMNILRELLEKIP